VHDVSFDLCKISMKQRRKLMRVVCRGSLKLENDGGLGIACIHWEEESFTFDGSSELTTGFLEEFRPQPLSLVTVAG
jgi:hypothetical protein